MKTATLGTKDRASCSTVPQIQKSQGSCDWSLGWCAGGALLSSHWTHEFEAVSLMDGTDLSQVKRANIHAETGLSKALKNEAEIAKTFF